MFYLDANFFVFAVLDNTKTGQKAREIQREILEGKKEALTSSLALDEVMWVLRKNNRNVLIRKVIEDIYAFPHLQVVGVSSLVPLRALQSMEKYGLKPRDAFHAAVMEELNVSTIVSDDPDFDRVKWIKRIKLE